MRWRSSSAVVLAAAALTPRGALAECSPITRQSPCFDADALRVPTEPSRFVGIPSGSMPSRGRWALGAATTYLARPVVLGTASPDPAGRDVLVVRNVVDAEVSAAFAPVSDLALSLALPFAAYRRGTGLVGVTSQDGAGLPTAAVRDVRLGAAYGILHREDAHAQQRTALAARLVLSLPTGDEDSFAGERGPVLAPSLSFSFSRSIFFAGAELGARLRRPVEIGGARLGTQLVTSLGVGADILSGERLTLALEAWVLPTVLNQERALPDGTRITSGDLTPAEWMLSAWTRTDDVTFSLGGGTAIPLSGETREATTGETASTHFAGVTSPSFRAVLLVRYAPGSATHPR